MFFPFPFRSEIPLVYSALSRLLDCDDALREKESFAHIPAVVASAHITASRNVTSEL